jgi:hypothetical protein
MLRTRGFFLVLFPLQGTQYAIDRLWVASDIVGLKMGVPVSGSELDLTERGQVRFLVVSILDSVSNAKDQEVRGDFHQEIVLFVMEGVESENQLVQGLDWAISDRLISVAPELRSLFG